MRIAGVILAAGQGTRMKSATPKVLHPLMGKPLILYSIDAVRQVVADRPYTVIGHGAEQIRSQVSAETEWILQEPQLGTGHALRSAEPALRGKADILLLTLADMPLIRPDTLKKIIELHTAQEGPITLLSVRSSEARGFGRVVRDSAGRIRAIVEEAQATEEQLEIEELNTSVYCFDASWVWSALYRIPISPKGEYYLTDLVEIAVTEGNAVKSLTLSDASQSVGINSRLDLAEASRLLRKRINEEWMLAGVTIIDPGSTYIEPEVKIGMDCVIWPNTYLTGRSVIGEDCVIGPGSLVFNTEIGRDCRVSMSVLEEAMVEESVDIGPFAHLRKGSHIGKGAHIGNFGEIKNSALGEGTKMGHFSYIGDATIGANVNIGAGTITCNFDGEKKHHTEIEEDAFIGSDTMLVAPLRIGKGARTGAGSVVTRDVPDDTLAVGMPARPIKKMRKSG